MSRNRPSQSTTREGPAVPDVLYRYWGKARRMETNGCAYHPAAYHCLDVAAAADAWWRLDAPLRRGMRHACGTDETRLRAWLLYFIALHDLGKWDVRFQLKAPEIAEILQPGVEAYPTPYDHGQGGYAAFVKEFECAGDNAHDWMRGVAGHHGSFPSNAEWKPPTASKSMKDADREARRLWLDFLDRLFLKPAGADLAGLPPPPPQLAGFCCVSDWLGSNEEFFPYENGKRDLADYFADRAKNAQRCLKENGLVRTPKAPGGMARVFPEKAPRGMQESVDEWPVAPGLTLIEASTGTGKTEAAIAYASRLLAAGLADGVIFALPTQATANAMLERLEAAAVRLFEGGTNVVLAHGRAKYNEEFMQLQASRPATIQEGEDASAQCSHWLASSRKRVFLGQIGVCTVDQVLLSVLPIRHHFVRGFGIHKSVLIVDEIHAYDSYMNGLLDVVLERQKRAGGSALLLSATLDARRRRQLLSLWAGSEAKDAASHSPGPYPLVSRVDDDGRCTWAAASSEPERKVAFDIRHTSGMKLGAAELARLAQAAKDGARAVLICNLVADAQDAARRLLDMGAPAELFHSRFMFGDRQDIEKRVLKDYGKDAPRAEGRILVATQVVEQSLDLDFDWMLTQLCPADLLFQRLGRLHRHERPRPEAFGSPRCTVVAPDSLDFGAHKHIYSNARALWRTQRLIEQKGEAAFPAAYREWIEAVYAGEPWPDEPPEIVRRYGKFEAEQCANRACALNLVNSETTPFDDTDGTLTALTRDGEMAAGVIPLVSDGGGSRFLNGKAFVPKDEDFEEQADRHSVPVPRHWAEPLPVDDRGRRLLHLVPSSGGRWEGVVGGLRWSYDTRFGLERRKDE